MFLTHDPTQPTKKLKNINPTQPSPTQLNPTRGSTQPMDNSGNVTKGQKGGDENGPSGVTPPKGDTLMTVRISQFLRLNFIYKGYWRNDYLECREGGSGDDD